MEPETTESETNSFEEEGAHLYVNFPSSIKYKKKNSSVKAPLKKGSLFDLYSNSTVIFPPDSVRAVGTGLFLQIPRGFYAQIYSRSSLALQDFSVPCGTIDSAYRGEVFIVLRNNARVEQTILAQTRIAQIAFIPQPEGLTFVEDELNETERGARRFGSSGRN